MRIESPESKGHLTAVESAAPPSPFDAPYALCGRPVISGSNVHALAGFSLLEVMIAMFVFFIVVFSVLGMVVQSLGAARSLQQQQADCGMVASMLSLSNTLEESFDSGDFEGVVGDTTDSGLLHLQLVTASG